MVLDALSAYSNWRYEPERPADTEYDKAYYYENLPAY